MTSQPRGGRAAGLRLGHAVQRRRGRRRGAVRFEKEVEGSESHLRLHLQHDAIVVVGKPDLGVTTLGEQLRFEDRLYDNGVELTGGNAHALAAEDYEPNR